MKKVGLGANFFKWRTPTYIGVGVFLFTFFLASFLSFFLGVHTSRAEVEPLINYQGKITNSAGFTVTDGDYDMRFYIYDAASGGSLLWTGTHTTANGNPIATIDGIFSTYLGSGSGNTLDLDFTGSAYYLEVEIYNGDTTSWETFNNRKQLVAVPQALNANNLVGDGRIDLDSTDEAQDGANINYNPTSGANDALEVVYGGGGGTGTALKVTQSGTGDILSLLDGATEVLRVADGGNVGIGIVGAPSYLLDTGGDINTSGTYRMGGLDFGQYFIDSAGTNGQIWTSDGTGRGYWAAGGSGGGDMYMATYDPANISEQLAGLTASQTLTNKTLDADSNIFSNIGVAEFDTDVQSMFQMVDGMSYDKPDMTIVDDSGLQMDIEKLGGGDMDFWIDGVKSTLDCTTGSGVSGKARVALIAGADANNPVTNYLYITDSSGTATLNASTTLPTGAFAWVGKVIVPDATTWATTGAYGFQRYTEAFSNNSRGAFSHAREKLRALGAVYIDGIDGALDITTNAGSSDNIHFETEVGEIYQLHRQSYPAFSTGPYYYGNGTNEYGQFTDLNAALNTVSGSSLSDKRFDLVIWGAVNITTGESKLFVNLPTGSYNNNNQARQDRNNTADYSVPDDFRSVAFLIARVAMRHQPADGGTWTELGTYSLLGTPPGIRSGGGGDAGASSEFDDDVFRVFDDVDSTKMLAFELDGITTGTTRTLSIPDIDGTIMLNLVEDTTPQLGGALDVNGQIITSASNGDVVIAPNGTGDFYVNTDDLFVDTSSGNVGIGTSTITDKLGISQSVSTSSDNGLLVSYAQTTDATNITGAGIRVAASGSGDAGDTMYGVNIDDITGSAASEIGLRIGTGWDTDLLFSDSSAVIQIANGGDLIITDGTNNLLEIKDMGTNFGGAMHSGAFIGRNSTFTEEFNKKRPDINNDTRGGGSSNSGVGDGGGWGGYESGSCSISTPDDTVNGMVRIEANNTNTGCLTMIDDDTRDRRGIIDANNLPVFLFKARPSNVGTNNRAFIGVADDNDGSTSDPTNFIGFTNNGGATWTGRTTNGGTSTNVACTGETVSTTDFALLMVEVLSTTDVAFYVDNDVSDGVDFTSCGSSTTNIPTVILTPEIMYKALTGGTSGTYLDVDFYRIWQDDNEATAAPVNVEKVEESFSEGSNLTQIYPTDHGEMDNGTLVSIDPSGKDLKVSPAFEREHIVGVIVDEAGLEIDNGSIEDGVRVATYGRVLIKVNDDNGSIESGEYLSVSSVAGVAAKAVESGMVLGRALEDHKKGNGEILAQINIERIDLDEDLVLRSLDGEIVKVDFDMKILEDMEVKGGLKVAGPVEFEEETFFGALAEFLDKVLFKKEVEFAEVTTHKSGLIVDSGLTLDGNSAGVATIKAGKTSVEVVFPQEYDNSVVVSVTPRKKVDLEWYRVTNETKKGFEIEISPEQEDDIDFSWIAVAVSGDEIEKSPELEEKKEKKDEKEKGVTDEIVIQEDTVSEGVVEGRAVEKKAAEELGEVVTDTVGTY